MYRSIQASRIYQQIVEQIEQAIRSGQLKPGNQLPAERELAQQFRVSRTAVREAVKALSEKGLVEALPGRGTFVIDGTSQVVRQSLDRMISMGQADAFPHLVDVREILEPEIAARAAGRAEEKHVVMMREAVAAMEAASGDADGFIEADLDFHLALAEATQNPLVLTLIDSIVGLLREQRKRTFGAPQGPAHGLFHHRRILEAIERRDAYGARQAMRAHLEQIREDTETGLLSEAGAQDSRTGVRADQV